jgi:hypothetical protein
LLFRYPLEVDRVVHAFGAAVVTLVAWRVLRSRVSVLDGSVFVLVALAGLGVSALEEISEFLFSRVWHSNIGGYVNTGWDLVFDFVGCVAAAWCLARTSGARTPSSRTASS